MSEDPRNPSIGDPFKEEDQTEYTVHETTVKLITIHEIKSILEGRV